MKILEGFELWQFCLLVLTICFLSSTFAYADGPWEYEQSLKHPPKQILCEQLLFASEAPIFCSSVPEAYPQEYLCNMCYGHFAEIPIKEFKLITVVKPKNKKLGELKYKFRKLYIERGPTDPGPPHFGKDIDVYAWWRGELIK